MIMWFFPIPEIQRKCHVGTRHLRYVGVLSEKTQYRVIELMLDKACLRRKKTGKCEVYQALLVRSTLVFMHFPK